MSIIITLLTIGGLFFFSVGTIGILRLPDFLTRAHSAAKCDTLATLLCLTALIIYSGLNYTSLKLLIIIIFLWITSPTATHFISKSFINKRGVKK